MTEPDERLPDPPGSDDAAPDADAAHAGIAEPGPGAPSRAHGDLGMERLDRRVVSYWWASGIVGLAILAMPVAGAFVLFQDRLPVAPPVALGALVVALGTSLVWQLIAPPLAWRRWRFVVGADLLVARYGIVFHEEKAIPISRLQHVDLTRGPIERLFGLATLVVHTAGTEAASFRLPGLAIARAAALRDQILEARGDDVV